MKNLISKQYNVDIPDTIDEKDIKDNPESMSSNLIEYRGIFLTKYEFEKCCKINKALETDKDILAAKDSSIEDKAVKIWENLLNSQFGFEIKLEKLELKEEVVNSGLKCPMIVWACRFQTDRPFLFLIIYDNGKVVFVDEKQFDAFDRGPFKKPKI